MVFLDKDQINNGIKYVCIISILLLLWSIFVFRVSMDRVNTDSNNKTGSDLVLTGPYEFTRSSIVYDITRTSIAIALLIANYGLDKMIKSTPDTINIPISILSLILIIYMLIVTFPIILSSVDTWVNFKDYGMITLLITIIISYFVNMFNLFNYNDALIISGIITLIVYIGDSMYNDISLFNLSIKSIVNIFNALKTFVIGTFETTSGISILVTLILIILLKLNQEQKLFDIELALLNNVSITGIMVTHVISTFYHSIPFLDLPRLVL